MECKIIYLPNFMFHLIIINRNQNTMAHTKQTPRYPNVDRPATAIGSDFNLNEEPPLNRCLV